MIWVHSIILCLEIGHITQGHLYPLYVRKCESKIFVAHEIMSVRIFLYILMKYKLKDTLYKEYNLGDRVYYFVMCNICYV